MGNDNWAALIGISNTRSKKYPYKITYVLQQNIGNNYNLSIKYSS